MLKSSAKIKYLLDTNILIGFSLWKPISLKLNNFFWSELGNTLKNGDWILLDVVVKEVQQGYDVDLKKWCVSQSRGGFVKKISSDNRSRAVEINNKYPMIDSVTGKSAVDTYLLAYAEENKVGIFSRESKRENNKKLYKIPDVCDVLNVDRLNKPKAFLREIGFN